MTEHECILPTVQWQEMLLDSASSSIYLESLIEHNPIAVVVLDAQHRFRLGNPAFEALFQYTADDLRTLDLDSLIAGPDFLHEAALFSQEVLRGRKVHAITRRRRKDGMMVDVEIYGIPLMMAGEVTGVYGLYQDLTERNRARRDQHEIADAVERVRLDERRRFARDLHDSTSQELTILNWNLTRLKRIVGERDAAARELIQETQDLAQQCGRRIRGTAYLLHAPVMGDAGLGEAIDWMVRGFAQRSGLSVTLDISLCDAHLPEPLGTAIYRIVQEGLANVFRHSPESTVKVMLTSSQSRLQLSFENKRTQELAPMKAHHEPRGEGVGILAMRERIAELDGSFQLTSGKGGTKILVEVPLVRGAA